MPSITFNTEIDDIKSEIATSLAASTYSAKDLVYVSKALESLSNVATSAGNFDNAYLTGILYVGTGAENFESAAFLTNPVAVFNANTLDYAQIAFKNSSSDATASTDFIAYTNNGDDNAGYIDMGITSSNFSDPDFTITGAGDGYIFMTGAAGGTDQGNLILATGDTGTQNKIIFAAGGLASDNTQMVITPDVNVHIEIPTPSTSPTPGALTIVGGLGISGDVNIDGSITFGGTSSSLETATLSVTDSLIFVGKDNSGDAVDLGLIAEYKIGAAKKYAGLVRDASDGVMKVFKDASTKPTTVVNFSEAGLAYGDVKANAIDVASATIGNVSNTEIGYLDGVTSAIQTQINTKAPSAAPTFTGIVVLPSTTSIGDVDATEIGYLNGVSSSIQTQLDAKAAAASYAALSGAAFTGNVQLEEVSEKVVDITLASNVATLDWTAGNVYYIATAATGAMTFNVTNVPTTVSKIMTINVFVTQGATGYVPSTFQIGGAGQTIKWAGGTTPTPTSSAGKIDIFSFTMQRTSGGAWLVYGAASLNY
jgi:hypothetical protein